MKIINKQALTGFTRKHADTVNSINRWVDIVESNDFEDHNDLIGVFPSADYVGKGRYVFNIKGNRYRLVVVVVFTDRYLRVKFCGTHAEYDRIKEIKNI